MWVFFLVVLVENTDGQATNCDSTCFFLPVGALGCAIADTLFPTAVRTRYSCQQWVDLVVLNVTLGQICVELADIGQVPATGRNDGQSSRENVAISRGERRSFEMSEKQEDPVASSRQSSVGVTFADAKAVCEEDLGGSLMNFNGLLPSSDCSNKFLDFLDIFEGTSFKETINDTGPTQNQIASLLPGTKFYVNATKHPTISYLYEYAVITGSPLNLHHYVSPNPGQCLSAVASDGQLQFQGADCEDEFFPLCFRTFDNLTAGINSGCNEPCSSLNFECQKWVSLTGAPFQALDGYYLIDDADLCLEPCNINGEKTSWYNAQYACEDMGGSLLSFSSFVDDLILAVTTTGDTSIQYSTFLNATKAENEDFWIMPSRGAIQDLLASFLASNGVEDTFYVNARQNGSFEYLYGKSELDFEQDFLAQFATLQASTSGDNCLTLVQDGTILELSRSARQTGQALIFEGINCFTELKPLCLKGNAVVKPISTPQRLRWKQQKNKNNKKMFRKEKTPKKNVHDASEGRQATPDPIADSCLQILPIVGIVALLSPATTLANDRPTIAPTITPNVAPTPQPPRRLNEIEDFNTFMNTYNRVYASAAEAASRQTIFLQSLATVQTHNLLFASGLVSYFMRVNRYSDMTFDEFRSQYLGLGLFNATGSFLPPRESTRGSLRQDIPAPDSLDLTNSGCITSIKNQLCNTCAAHSTTATVEYCLCRASGQLPESRSVQQISECTDGRGLDVGSQIERVNTFCVSGFPDVHLDFVIKELNGNIDAESNNEESEINNGCNRFSRDFTSARVVDYVSDIFTDEEHLLDAVSQIGPTATNIAVTSKIQFYGGGVYYEPVECTDYAFEDVPPECVEERNGRMTYTCVEKNGVKCSELLPHHCDIFFVQSETSYPHSLTAIGYDQESDGTLFWKMKNSWGTDWGESGFLRIARGLGHCGVGSMFTVPLCRVGK